jgi:hypothetical protein
MVFQVGCSLLELIGAISLLGKRALMSETESAFDIVGGFVVV